MKHHLKVYRRDPGERSARGPCRRVEEVEKEEWAKDGWSRKSGWWFQWFLIITPYLGNWSNLTNIFQMCWNHQLEICGKHVLLHVLWIRKRLRLLDFGSDHSWNLLDPGLAQTSLKCGHKNGTGMQVRKTTKPKKSKFLKEYDLGVSIPVSRCQSNIKISYKIRIQHSYFHKYEIFTCC